MHSHCLRAEAAVDKLSITKGCSVAGPAVEGGVGCFQTTVGALVTANGVSGTIDDDVLQNNLFAMSAVVVDEDTAERTGNSDGMMARRKRPAKKQALK